MGGSVTLHEPGNAQTYQLTALDVRSETLELPDCDGWEWPNRFCMMTYRLTPAAENFFLSDCAEGDYPRRRPRNLPPERAALEKKYGIKEVYQSQKDCVWMLKQNGGGICDHEVLRP